MRIQRIYKLGGTLLISMLLPAVAAAAVTIDGVVYGTREITDNETGEVSRYAFVSKTTSDLPENVVIPDSVEEDGIKYPVTKLGASSFTGTNIKSIKLSKHISEITAGPFKQCVLLERVEVTNPDETVFKKECFKDCENLVEVAGTEKCKKLMISRNCFPPSSSCDPFETETGSGDFVFTGNLYQWTAQDYAYRKMKTVIIQKSEYRSQLTSHNYSYWDGTTRESYKRVFYGSEIEHLVLNRTNVDVYDDSWDHPNEYGEYSHNGDFTMEWPFNETKVKLFEVSNDGWDQSSGMQIFWGAEIETLLLPYYEGEREYGMIVPFYFGHQTARPDEVYGERCLHVKNLVLPIATPPPFSLKEMVYDAYKSAVFKETTLYVPDGSEELYRAAKGWELFESIRPMSELPVSGMDSPKVEATSPNYVFSGRLLTLGECDRALVCKVSGEVVYSGAGEAKVDLPAPGLYIINIDGRSAKVMVR